MYGELLNLCLYDPEEDGTLSLQYLTRVNCGVTGDYLLSCFGSMDAIGHADAKSFIDVGIYPVFLSYIKKGKQVRALEYALDGLSDAGKNIVKAEGRASALLRKIGHKRKTA